MRRFLLTAILAGCVNPYHPVKVDPSAIIAKERAYCTAHGWKLADTLGTIGDTDQSFACEDSQEAFFWIDWSDIR